MTKTKDERDQETVAVDQALHYVGLMKATLRGLARLTAKKHPDDAGLANVVALVSEASHLATDHLLSAAGIQARVIDPPAPCDNCTPLGLCDNCWDVRYDELVSAVYFAGREVLQSWGVEVDHGEHGAVVGEALDCGLADGLWTWVQFHVPAHLREVRNHALPEHPSIDQATDYAVARWRFEVDLLLYRMGITDHGIASDAATRTVIAHRESVRQIIADARAAAEAC